MPLHRMSSVLKNLYLAGMARVETMGFHSTLQSIASPNLDVRFKTRAAVGVE
jgi:hypothetical protein